MRLLLSPALGWLLVWLFGLLLEPLMLWVIITYLLCLGLEVIWIVRALRRSTTGSKRRSAGETDTDKQHSTRNYEI
jgi:hypothetical protein